MQREKKTSQINNRRTHRSRTLFRAFRVSRNVQKEQQHTVEKNKTRKIRGGKSKHIYFSEKTYMQWYDV